MSTGEACSFVDFRLPHAKISGPQGGVKRLLFGCERQKSEFFVLPTVGNGTRLGAFTSRRWLNQLKKGPDKSRSNDILGAVLNQLQTLLLANILNPQFKSVLIFSRNYVQVRRNYGRRPVISCEGREVLQRTRVRQVFQRGVV